MEKDSEKFLNNLRSVHLTQDEKSDIRDSVLSFVEETSQSALTGEVRKDKEFSSQIGFWSILKWKYALTAVVLFAVTGGGVSAAASSALPGDILYLVKVNFNEEIRGALTFSEEGRIAWEEERAERRLEEAQTLVMAGDMSGRAMEQITDNFDRHVGQVASRIKGFEESNMGAVIEMSSRFESTLAAHEEILDRLASLRNDDVEGTENIAMRVRVKTEDISRIRESAQSSLSGEDRVLDIDELEERELSMEILSEDDEGVQLIRKNAAERMERAAIQKIDEFESMISRFIKEDLLSREGKIEDVREKVDRSKAFLEDGEKHFKDENYGEAFISFRDAFGSAHRSSLFLRAEITLKVELNGSSKDDTEIRDSDVLPVEEKFLKIDPDNKEESVKEIEEAVAEKLTTVEETFLSNDTQRPREVIAEIESGISVSKRMISEALEKLENEEFEESFSLFRQAYGVLVEIESILGPDEDVLESEGGNKEKSEDTEKNQETDENLEIINKEDEEDREENKEASDNPGEPITN